jgi:hypothetical protein
MPAEEDKGRDVPAHDEDAGGEAYDGGAYGVDLAEVFGGKKKGIGAVGPHEPTVQGAEEDQPKDQQYLELFYM